MRQNIATVKAHTPVLGKLARMRQMQGKASRLDIGLAAFSERVAQRVMKRGKGQWRRFSLDYLMDEEKEQQTQRSENVQQNIDLDVLVSLRAGESDAGAHREFLERQVETLAMRTLTRLQPEVLLRKYDIHNPVQMMGQRALRNASDTLSALPSREERNPVRGTRPVGMAQSSPAARTLMERALRTERTVEKRILKSAQEFARTQVLTKENQMPGTEGAGTPRSADRARMQSTQRQMLADLQAQTLHIMTHPAAKAVELQQFAQTQMAQAQGDVVMRRAGEVLRERRWVVREESFPMGRVPLHSAGMPTHAGVPVQTRTIASVQPLQPQAQLTDAVRQMQLRNLFMYEELAHAGAENAAHQGAETPMPQSRADRQAGRWMQERTRVERAAVLWRVLERSTERLLSGAMATAARPGEAERSAAERILIRQDRLLRERRVNAGTAQMDRVPRETQTRHRVGQGSLAHGSEFGAQSAAIAALAMPLAERRTILEGKPGAPGVNGQDGMPGRVPYGNPSATQERILREVQQRSRFGLETLVYAEGLETQNLPAAEGQTPFAGQPEHEVQRIMERQLRAQTLREVLERSSERMLRSVERAVGVPGREGLAGAPGWPGAAGRDGRAGISGQEGAVGSDGLSVQTAIQSAEQRIEYNDISNRYGVQPQSASAKERLMRRVELRSRFGVETLTYAQEASDAKETPLVREAQTVLRESSFQTRAEHAQVLRNVLERTTERMLRQFEPQKQWLAPAVQASLPAGAEGVHARFAASAQAMEPSVHYGAQTVPQNAAQRLVQEVELRSRYGYEMLTYADDGAQSVRDSGAAPQRTQTVRMARGGNLHDVLQRAVEAAARREALLLRPNTFGAMNPILHTPRTMARPLRTAVEGQTGMTMLLRKREEDAPRSTLEMIARAGQGESPLRSSILTQPAEIVMYVPPTTMSVYGAETPRVGNLSWEETPAPESRATPQAALRLMQKAQQKFGSQARYRPPEMVMKETGDATGKLASQQMGQPRNINQEMRARKTVIRESSSQELTNTEITRIVDKVYDKIERKIATEYRRRGR